MWRRHRQMAAALLALGLAVSACSSAGEDATETPEAAPITTEASTGQTDEVELGATPPPDVPDGEATLATASLLPSSGSDAQGLVAFDPVDGGLIVSVEATGLGGGRHGIHIHENGDCSALDASSAGEHFDPDGNKLGDLEDVISDEAGAAFVDVLADGLGLWGDTSVIGRSIVIHSADDPDVRVACGVIEAAG